MGMIKKLLATRFLPRSTEVYGFDEIDAESAYVYIDKYCKKLVSRELITTKAGFKAILLNGKYILGVDVWRLPFRKSAACDMVTVWEYDPKGWCGCYGKLVVKRVRYKELDKYIGE